MPYFERTSQARLDLVEIVDFIARDNPVAAFRLLDRLEEKFAMLARQPLIGEPRDDLGEGVRQFTVGNYVIYYRSLDDGALILRVLHGARDVRSLFGF